MAKQILLILTGHKSPCKHCDYHHMCDPDVGRRFHDVSYTGDQHTLLVRHHRKLTRNCVINDQLTDICTLPTVNDAPLETKCSDIEWTSF